MSDIAIKFENVGKLYRLGLVGTGTLSHDLKRWWITSVRGKDDPYLKIGETNDRSTKGASDYVYALKDINFEVKQGDVIGIIGKNGAGKSTLLKLLSRVTYPTTGKIYTKGRIASLLEVGTGFHPELTGRENIYMNGSILGMKKWEIDKQLDAIIDFSGCERYIDTPVKRYSSGMTVRLGFAIAAHLNPEILVVDEVLAVGDAEFQKKAIGKMQDVSKGEGRTVLFVSHNMASVRSLCKNGIVLQNGMIKYTGTADECVDFYMTNSTALQSKKIKDYITRLSPYITIKDIKINGTNVDNTIINHSQNIIKLSIEGHTTKEFKFSLQFKLRNANGAVLTTYSEGAYMDYLSTIEQGDFLIERNIILPSIIGTGICHAEIELNRHSMERVDYYLLAKNCSCLYFEGTYKKNAHPIKILEEGFIGLESTEIKM